MTAVAPDVPEPPPPPRWSAGRGTRALRHRGFRLLWAGQWARATGLWMQLVATPLLLLSLGGGPVELGVAYALQFGPILVLAPFGGAVADRFDKRVWLMTLQAVTAVQALGFVVVTATDLVTIPIVFALAGLLGLVNAGEIPTRVSFVGEVVPDDEVPNAVALMLVAMNASRVLGPALAGLLAAAFGYAANFTWSLIAALIAVALVGLIDADRPTRVTTSSAESITRSVVSAARHVATHRPIRLGLSLLAVFGLFGVSFQTVAPVFAVGTLGLDEVGYGFFVAAMGAGALVAALPMTLVGAGRAQRLMVLAPIAFAVVLAALAITRLPLVAFALVVPLGFFFVLVNSTINVTVQGTIEHEFRGRAMGLYVSIMHGGGAIGAVIMGALAARTGAPVAMLLAAAGLVVTTAVLRATAGPPSPASATVR